MMCHLQTHPNSTWGSTVEGKGGPSPVSKKIAQNGILPGELPEITNPGISGKSSGVGCTVVEEVVTSSHNQVARQRHLDTYGPKSRGLVCQPLATFWLSEKVPPDPLQTGYRTSFFRTSSLNRGYNSNLSLDNLVLIIERIRDSVLEKAKSVFMIGVNYG